METGDADYRRQRDLHHSRPIADGHVPDLTETASSTSQQGRRAAPLSPANRRPSPLGSADDLALVEEESNLARRGFR